MSSEQPIILYHYPFSPFTKRILWYLQLRGIPFKQCVSSFRMAYLLQTDLRV